MATAATSRAPIRRSSSPAAADRWLDLHEPRHRLRSQRPAAASQRHARARAAGPAPCDRSRTRGQLVRGMMGYIATMSAISTGRAAVVVAWVAAAACGPSHGQSDGSGAGSESSLSDAATSHSSPAADATGSAASTNSVDGTGSAASTNSSDDTTTGAQPADVCDEHPFQRVGPLCEGGSDIAQSDGGAVSGMAVCEGGAVHRYGIACCASADPSACTAATGACTGDEDCSDGAGRGICTNGGYLGSVCVCEYVCNVDADCGDGYACICGFGPADDPPTRPTCVAAGCRTDADCGEYRCGLSPAQPCAASWSLQCHTAADECVGPADCGGDPCMFVEAQARWVCGPLSAPPCD